MKLFNFLKKDKIEVKTEFTVNELKKGFMVDYFLKTWEVKKVYIYDWGDNFFAREYLLDSGDESLYLYVEDDDGLVCNVWNRIHISEVEPDLAEYIVEHDEAPNKITYNQKLYKRIESSQGYRNEEGEEKYNEELVNWMFKNKKEKQLLSLDRTGEEEFEISHGHYVKEIEFSNILPI